MSLINEVYSCDMVMKAKTRRMQDVLGQRDEMMIFWLVQ